MTFFTEPTGYEKTILSDLQGTWQVLRQDIVDQAGYPGWKRMLLHVDEAMSWETVRHLPRMRPLLLLIRNLGIQNQEPAVVFDRIEDVSDLLDEVLSPGTADCPPGWLGSPGRVDPDLAQDCLQPPASAISRPTPDDQRIPDP